jgi:hypothetical protein
MTMMIHFCYSIIRLNNDKTNMLIKRKFYIPDAEIMGIGVFDKRRKIIKTSI